ncbi:MAG: hypothetical protein E7K04_00980 [Helicobacter sp.]|nr:hypothetical protein [Helicobacter sp.]
MQNSKFLTYILFFFLFFSWNVLFFGIFGEFGALILIFSSGFFTTVFYAINALCYFLFLFRVLDSQSFGIKAFLSLLFCLFVLLFIKGIFGNSGEFDVFFDELSLLQIFALYSFDIVVSGIFYIFILLGLLFMRSKNAFVPSFNVISLALIASSFQLFYFNRAWFFYIDLAIFGVLLLLFFIRLGLSGSSAQIRLNAAFLVLNVIFMVIFNLFGDLQGIFDLRYFFYELVLLLYGYQLSWRAFDRGEMLKALRARYAL